MILLLSFSTKSNAQSCYCTTAWTNGYCTANADCWACQPGAYNTDWQRSFCPQFSCSNRIEVRQLSCPVHYTGFIAETRTFYCTSNSYSAWIQTANTCVQDPPTCSTSTQTQTLSCETGYTGTINQTRTSTCSTPYSTPTWGAWITTSNTCTKSVTNLTNVTSPVSPVSPVTNIIKPPVQTVQPVQPVQVAPVAPVEVKQEVKSETKQEDTNKSSDSTITKPDSKTEKKDSKVDAKEGAKVEIKPTVPKGFIVKNIPLAVDVSVFNKVVIPNNWQFPADRIEDGFKGAYEQRLHDYYNRQTVNDLDTGESTSSRRSRMVRDGTLESNQQWFIQGREVR